MEKSVREIRNRMVVYGALSVFLVLLRESSDKDKVRGFIRQVALDDGLSRDDPRKALNRHLLKTRFIPLHRPSYVLGRPYAISMATVWCWNKYVRGQTLIDVKPNIAKTKKPIEILTTNRIINQSKK